MKTLLPEGWPRPSGYANGMRSTGGRMIFVAGQIGWDPLTGVVADGFLAQLRQVLANIRAVLDADGAGPEHLVRLTWYVTDRGAYVDNLQAIGQVWREEIGRHYPAMACVFVSALVEADAMIEIEATAVVEEGA